MDHLDDVNLTDHLLYRHVREGRGSQVALRLLDGSSMTYMDVARCAAAASRRFRAAGVAPGDRIVLLAADSPAFVTAFFGALAAGAIAVPLNPHLLAEDVYFIAAHMEAKAVVMGEAYAHKFERLSSLSTLTQTWTVSDTTDPADMRSDVPLETTPAPTDLAYCLFSSGTTGKPKGIVHRHVDILHCANAYADPVLGMSDRDTVMAVPKLSFGYGLGGNLLFSFLYGGTATLIPSPSRVDVICDALERFRPTLLLAQPRIVAELLRTNVPSSVMSSLRLAVSAGEVLSSTLYAEWRERYGVELLDGFGSTEMGHVFISNYTGCVRPGSAGKPLFGYDVRIVGESGEDLADGEIGMLWARGASAAVSYWNDEVRSRSTFVDGWVISGDLFRRDADGSLYACGRADEMIKAGCGEWVSPTEIEGLLLQHDEVVEAAVVGFSDADGIVRPKAFVVASAGVKPTRELAVRLQASVVSKWPELPHKHLAAVEFLHELPRTATGKIQRFKLAPKTLTEFAYEC